MSKLTRIFCVEYTYNQVFDGKVDSTTIKDKMSVVADNAAIAIARVGESIRKKTSVIKSEDTGKMIKCTNARYCPFGVTLEAEA